MSFDLPFVLPNSVGTDAADIFFVGSCLMFDLVLLFKVESDFRQDVESRNQIKINNRTSENVCTKSKI